MLNNPFFHFLTLELFKERKKHIGVVLISLVVLFLLSSVLFISSSIQYSLKQALKQEPDFVVQRIQGGERINVPDEWIDPLLEIYGIDKVTTRVYGRYFFESKRDSFLLVGVDFMDEQSHRELSSIMNELDLKKFLNTDNMLMGEGVWNYLKDHYYPDSYNFLTPSGEFKKVNIFKVFPKKSNLLTNDIIVVPQELAKEILGLKENEISDIALNVPNIDEWDSIEDKIDALYYDVRVVTKRDITKAYENLYNYKGGVFLIMFLIAIVTFVLIMYQRYAMVHGNERRHIGLLRALGWSIRDVLKLKLFETLIVVFISFILGVVLAYIYVFIFSAPIFKEIFLGGANLANSITLVPIVNFNILSTIFLIYAVPFIAAVLIPVWKISVTDPKEAML